MGGPQWITGAERLTPSAPGGAMSEGPGGPPRVIWHTTEGANFDVMRRVLTDKGAEPHVLYDPASDRLGQFLPLNVSGRAVKNAGSVRNNRVGLVCIQVEVCGYAAHPFTDTWRPGPNFAALMAAIRAWGIPDVWPAGPPPPYPRGSDPRSMSVWLTRGGHFGHSQIPGNDHGDPGAINTTAIFAAAPQGDDMPTVQEVWEYPITRDAGGGRLVKIPMWRSVLDAVDTGRQATAAVARLAADVAGLSAAVKALAAGTSVDLDAVQAAARAGAEQALAEGVKVDVSVGGQQ